MEDKTITLTLTEAEARLVLRAVKARINHWSSPDQIRRTSNSSGIRRMYRDVLESIESQAISQNINA